MWLLVPDLAWTQKAHYWGYLYCKDSMGRCLWWPEKDVLTHFSVMFWQLCTVLCMCVCCLNCFQCLFRLVCVCGGGSGGTVMSWLARCGPDSKRRWHFANILLLPFSCSSSHCIFMLLLTLGVVDRPVRLCASLSVTLIRFSSTPIKFII